MIWSKFEHVWETDWKKIAKKTPIEIIFENGTDYFSLLPWFYVF